MPPGSRGLCIAPNMPVQQSSQLMMHDATELGVCIINRPADEATAQSINYITYNVVISIWVTEMTTSNEYETNNGTGHL